MKKKTKPTIECTSDSEKWREPSAMVHAYNPNYSGGRDQEK
jgi:hypothetical protein